MEFHIPFKRYFNQYQEENQLILQKKLACNAYNNLHLEVIPINIKKQINSNNKTGNKINK